MIIECSDLSLVGRDVLWEPVAVRHYVFMGLAVNIELFYFSRIVSPQIRMEIREGTVNTTYGEVW